MSDTITYAEAAERLGLSKAAIASRVHTGRLDGRGGRVTVASVEAAVQPLDPSLLTLRQAAELLGVSRRRVEYFVAARRLVPAGLVRATNRHAVHGYRRADVLGVRQRYKTPQTDEKHVQDRRTHQESTRRAEALLQPARPLCWGGRPRCPICRGNLTFDANVDPLDRNLFTTTLGGRTVLGRIVCLCCGWEASPPSGRCRDHRLPRPCPECRTEFWAEQPKGGRKPKGEAA